MLRTCGEISCHKFYMVSLAGSDIAYDSATMPFLIALHHRYRIRILFLSACPDNGLQDNLVTQIL